MNKSRVLTFFIAYLLLFSSTLSAQDISIASISVEHGYYDANIEISGSGFNSTPANNEVWFGASQGTIVSASENLIIASVPAGATSSAITVLNKSTGLSAASSEIFHPIFQGAANPDLTITDGYSFPNSKELFDLVMIDLDKDGKNDIVASKIDNTATKFVVYRNVTTGSNIDFVEQEIAIGTPTSKVAAGDIDGDGKPDIILARELTNRFQIYVLKNTSTPGNISFAPPQNYFIRATQFAKKIVIRDLNLDGKPEVVVTNTSDDEISIFVNNSTIGNINLDTTPIRFNTGGTTSNDMIIEDFNNDGKHDIVVTQFAASDIIILPNNSSSGSLQFAAPITLTINGTLNNLAAGDLNEDGKPDIVVTDPFDNNISVVLNQSTTDIDFASPEVFTAGSGSASLTLVDYVGNGRLDILVSSSSGSEFIIYTNTSSGGVLTLTKTLIPQTNRSLNIVAGDLSDDAKPDIAVTAQDATGTNYFLVALRNNICIDPIIISDANPSICNSQTFRFLTAPSLGTNFIWKKDGIGVKNSADPFYDATAAGNYTVTAESEGGTCSKESPMVTLTLNSGSIPNDPIASNNGPTCIDGSITLSTIAVTGATYIWTGPNGFSSSDQNPVLTNITPDMAGTYIVKALISPCESNSSSTIVEVINPPDLTVSRGSTGRICEGESVTLTVGSAAGYTYQWFKDNVLISGATFNVFTASETGSFTVNLQGVSNNCDLISAPVTVETFPPPSPIFSSSGSLCVGSTISFSESTTVESDQVPTYSWDFGDMSPVDNTPTPTHIYNTASTFTVTLTMGYQNHSCSNFTSTTITIDQPTAFTIQVTGNIPFCEGDSVLLEVPTTGFTSATWSTGQQGLSIYAKTAGTITVDATNTSGCISTDQIDLTTLAAPIIAIIAENEILSLGQSTQLEATGADSYVWSPSESLNDTTIATPIATPQTTTLYQVIGTDLDGCKGSAEITISVEDTGNALPVDAPRLFSPNNDGIDDLWVISNIQNFPTCELVIFSRNGKTVFEARGYNNDWNGIDTNGSDLPEGAYYYTITCPDNGKTASGSISIIR